MKFLGLGILISMAHWNTKINMMDCWTESSVCELFTNKFIYLCSAGVVMMLAVLFHGHS